MALLAGAVIVAAVAVLNILFGDHVPLAAMMLGPFITARWGSERSTTGVGALSVVLMILSGDWNDNFGTDEYLIRVLIISAGALFAVGAARSRDRLHTLEQQRSATLRNLAEAVTVQDAEGRLVYANDAAARALGFATADELLATPVNEIVDAFESFNEDGTPLRMEQLPGRKALAGELEPEPLLLRARHKATGEERWRVTKATPVIGRDGTPQLAVNIIEDVTEVKRAELSQRFLAEASRVLSSSMDYEATLAQVARTAVPELADWCSVSLPDEAGYLRAVAVAHVDPQKIAFAREYNERFPTRLSDPAGAAQVMREGHPQVVNDIGDDLLAEAIADPEQLAAIRQLGLRAVIIVPLVAANEVIGVMTFVSAESGRTFSDADLALAEELGRRAGTAVQNARVYTERSHIARTLQASLLPAALPDIPGFGLASLYRPAGEENLVGGDFYDAFPTKSGWVVMVGDVTGRGVEAAALTADARHTLRTAAELLSDTHAALEHLNAVMAVRAEQSLCTAALVLLAENRGRVTATVLCAGHPAPLLVRRGDVEVLHCKGQIIGAWTDSSWEPRTLELERGDLLVLYTDGVTDARAGDERFGDARLIEVIRAAKDESDAVRRISDALAAFEQGPQADDTAVLALRRAA